MHGEPHAGTAVVRQHLVGAKTSESESLEKPATRVSLGAAQGQSEESE